jgi:hypothetical protein
MKYLYPLAALGLYVFPLSGAKADDAAPTSAPTASPAQARADTDEKSKGSLDERLRALEQKETERQAKETQAAKESAAATTAYTPQSEGPAPFAYADFSWAPGNYGSSEKPYTLGPFSGELLVDTAYHYSFANPKDNTIVGSAEVFRSNEFQLTQLGFGGDFYYKGVMARMMTQFGMYSETQPRNDSSPSRGQWNLADAYRYLAEAYAGYHWEKWSGINVQAGIFMSYVGLWSWYNFENWTYQPSYVSSNTPFFFNGMRVQIFTSDKLKIEPWLVNGWQSYGKFNQAPGVGLQVQWKPAGWLTINGNQYFGMDELGIPNQKRIHTDDSVMVKYYDNPIGVLSKAAASLTLDAGCEWSPTVTCSEESFLGFMAYNRLWFLHDHFGLTVGGGAITNPGRYLVLLPPINGATASTGSYYFPMSPGLPFKAWDMQVTGDWMPTQNITFRLEFVHRWANVPYFAGSGGVTPPGGNNGAPGVQAPNGWAPDLVQTENRVTLALMLKL